jgi:tetratricopeptide (TPR) repeat protein
VSKNKGKFGRARPEIAKTDEFLTGMDRLVNALKPHAVKIGVGIAAIAILSIGYAAYSGHTKRKDARATVYYAEAVRLASLPIREAPLEPRTTEPDVVTSFPNREAQVSAALSKLEALQDRHGSSGVARQALLLHADLLMDAGRHDEAARIYSDYARSDGQPMLRLLAREGFAYALEARALATEDAAARQEGLAAALEAFVAMQPEAEGPMHDRALYHQGRLLAALGRRDEALETYRKVLELASAELRPTIEQRLAALDAEPR